MDLSKNHKSIIKELASNIYTGLNKGYCENIYHNAFKIELQNNNIKYQSRCH